MSDKEDLLPDTNDRQDLLQRLADLTQANQSLQREMYELKQRHLDRLNSFSDGLYSLDLVGNLTFVNRAIEHMAGRPAEELLGRHYRNWVDPSIFAEIEAGRQRVLQGETVRNEVEIVNDQGQRYCLEFNAGPIWLEGHIIGSQGILRDVTARKQVERRDQENRKLLDSLFNAITETLLLIDFRGVIKACNATCAYRLGCRPEDMIGRESKKFIPFDVYQFREQQGLKALRDNKPIRFVDERAGAIYDITVYPSLDPDTQEGQFVIFARDITQQRMAERALVESECRYRSLVEGACENIAMHDDEGRILFLNSRAAKNFGGNPSDFVGKLLHEVMDESYASQHLAFMQRVMNAGKSETSEQYLVDPEGNPTWLRMTVIPLQSLEKQRKTAMVIAQDITPLKLAQEELKLFRDKMARAEQLASAGTLSAMVAHEFAQPLTVMRLSVQNALASLDKGNPDWLKGDLQDCLKEISNVSVILERFRSFAKVALERKNEEVMLGPLMDKTVTLFQDNAKSLTLSVDEKSFEGLPRVWGCEKDLEQLFFILIENSLQALGGRHQGQLHISAKSVDHRIAVQLQDTCGGVAPEHMHRIFEPFFTTKGHQQGTGLGLCIVQRILEETGGRIDVDNRPGEGVTFTVTLPVMVASS